MNNSLYIREKILKWMQEKEVFTSEDLFKMLNSLLKRDEIKIATEIATKLVDSQAVVSMYGYYKLSASK